MLNLTCYFVAKKNIMKGEILTFKEKECEGFNVFLKYCIHKVCIPKEVDYVHLGICSLIVSLKAQNIAPLNFHLSNVLLSISFSLLIYFRWTLMIVLLKKPHPHPM